MIFFKNYSVQIIISTSDVHIESFLKVFHYSHQYIVWNFLHGWSVWDLPKRTMFKNFRFEVPPKENITGAQIRGAKNVERRLTVKYQTTRNHFLENGAQMMGCKTNLTKILYRCNLRSQSEIRLTVRSNIAIVETCFWADTMETTTNLRRPAGLLGSAEPFFLQFFTEFKIVFRSGTFLFEFKLNGMRNSLWIAVTYMVFLKNVSITKPHCSTDYEMIKSYYLPNLTR